MAVAFPSPCPICPNFLILPVKNTTSSMKLSLCLSSLAFSVLPLHSMHWATMPVMHFTDNHLLLGLFSLLLEGQAFVFRALKTEGAEDSFLECC